MECHDCGGTKTVAPDLWIIGRWVRCNPHLSDLCFRKHWQPGVSLKTHVLAESIRSYGE
jgi:hypothetical protein